MTKIYSGHEVVGDIRDTVHKSVESLHFLSSHFVDLAAWTSPTGQTVQSALEQLPAFQNARRNRPSLKQYLPQFAQNFYDNSQRKAYKLEQRFYNFAFPKTAYFLPVLASVDGASAENSDPQDYYCFEERNNKVRVHFASCESEPETVKSDKYDCVPKEHCIKGGVTGICYNNKETGYNGSCSRQYRERTIWHPKWGPFDFENEVSEYLNHPENLRNCSTSSNLGGGYREYGYENAGSKIEVHPYGDENSYENIFFDEKSGASAAKRALEESQNLNCPPLTPYGPGISPTAIKAILVVGGAVLVGAGYYLYRLLSKTEDNETTPSSNALEAETNEVSKKKTTPSKYKGVETHNGFTW